jgi:formylglycine-generating enzyme required for sulfatase activity
VFRDRLKSGREGIEMVVVAAGSFQMGDVLNDGDKSAQPVHMVTIQKPFAIGRYEVTFEEYDQFAQATGRKLPNDGGGGRGRRPVINFSWREAVDYAQWLSTQAGKRYRLPTEAEWEYAASGGKETAYWWGNQMKSGIANCAGCGSEWDNKLTAPVGSFQPNPFGLYDTAGNVWEWVEDCDHENYNGAPTDGSAWKKEGDGNCYLRVIRGGAWNYQAKGLRSSFRGRSDPGLQSYAIGLRLVQDID